MGRIFICSSLIFTLVALFLGGCQSDSSPPTASWQEIQGREQESNGIRTALYRMHIPYNWIRRDPLPTASLADTTLSLCDFFILEEEEKIRIAIHNFPFQAPEDRIPPTAQIARWKRQFDVLFNEASSVIPQAFSGYSGLLFVGAGKKNNTDEMVLAWSLQLAPEHDQSLSLEKPLEKQLRADVTIKASGPQKLMEKYRDEIISSARSFELIEEIPAYR